MTWGLVGALLLCDNGHRWVEGKIKGSEQEAAAWAAGLRNTVVVHGHH